MFEITLNGKTLYNPNSEECNVTKAIIHEALNDAGYMDITLPYSNPMYSEIDARKGTIIVYKDNVEMWYGEIRDVSVDFSKNKTIYVVGEATYLNDTVQPQREIKGTRYQVLQELINHHNSMVEVNKQFQVGMIGDGASQNVTVVTDWQYTLDAIREHLCKEEEYFRIRHIGNDRFIDIMPIDSYGKRSDQNIMFGDNLLDYAEVNSGENIATVCIPLGARLEESNIEGYDNYLTCEIANNGKNYVELPGAINRLGKITKVVHFNVLTDPNALVTAAVNYLQSSQYAKLTLKLSAVDLSILHSDIDNYNVGDYVRAICEPMGMDAWFPVRKRETDLLNLANNKIEIGSEGTKSITAQNAESITDLEKIMPNKDSILSAAKKNATALINGAGDNGHVVFHTNDDGVVYEILIMDTDDINTAQKIWRWNENGFGYSKDGGNTYGLAMTMDGSINANYITSGTLTGREINNGNGTFKVDESGNMTASSASIIGDIKSQNGAAYLEIKKGLLTTNGTIVAQQLSVGDSGNVFAGSISSSSINSASYSANGMSGQTKICSFANVYVDGKMRTACALSFTNGILTGVSYSE